MNNYNITLEQPNKNLLEAIENLLATHSGTQALNRNLGISTSYVDMPIALAQEKMRQELYILIHQHFPILKIISINFSYNELNKLEVEVKIKNV